MFIVFIFNLIKCSNITWTNYSFGYPQLIPLIVDKTVFSRNMDEFGSILNYSMHYESTQFEEICHLQYQNLYFRRVANSVVAVIDTIVDQDIDTLKTEEIESGFLEEITSYVYKKQSIMLLQTNGTLHHIMFENQTRKLNHSTYNLTICSNTQNNPLLLEENGAFYYVEGGEFIKFIIQDNQIYQFPFSNWKTIYGHYKALLRNNFVYIINGRNGLTIFKIDNHMLLLVSKIEANELYGTSQTIIELVDFVIEKDLLYILDYSNGVVRFNLTQEQMDKNFFIPQSGYQIMTIKNNTIMLSHSNIQRSITIEGIIDNNNWVVIRKKMTPKQIIKKIVIFDNFALLMSNSINQVYQIKLLENFTDPTLCQGENLYSHSLIGIEEVDENSAIGVFKHGIAIYYKFELPGQLICQGSIPQLNKVGINITSTNCLNKNQSLELNYCQSYLEYEFDMHEVLMSPWQESVYLLMCFVSGAVAIGLFFTLFILYNRYNMKRERLDEIKKQQRKRRL